MPTMGMFNIAVANVLWSMVAGERLDHSKQSPASQLVDALESVVEERGSTIAIILLNFPRLSRLFDKMGISVEGEAARKQVAFAKEAIRMNKASYEEGHLYTFCHHYMAHAESMSGKDGYSSFKGNDGLINFYNVLIDFFQAGSHTSSNTLKWAVLFMILHPDIQERVRKELESVFGPGQKPSYIEHLKTPYTEAVLHEIQRKGDILTVSVPHGTNDHAAIRVLLSRWIYYNFGSNGYVGAQILP